MLSALGKTVLISNFRRFHRLAAYLSRYTKRPIGMAMGASKLAEIFDEKLLQRERRRAAGRPGPALQEPGRGSTSIRTSTWSPGHKLTVENFPVPPHLRHLYAHLVENRFIQAIRNYNADLLPIRSQDVLAKIQSGDASWEQLVPPMIAEIIKRDGLFGYGGAGAAVGV